MRQKQIKAENMKIGKKYWLVKKGLNIPDHIRPLLYIGMKEKNKYWFTFGEKVDQWKNNFNFVCSKSSYKFYEEGAYLK